MGFVYGSFDTASVTGLTAVLQKTTNLPGLSLATISAAGQDGAFYASSSLGQGSWVFDLTLEAGTPSEVLSLADLITAALDPSDGLQDLRIDPYTGWIWRAIASAQIQWTRQMWTPAGPVCQLVGTVAFACPDPYSYASPDESVAWTTTGTRTFTRQKGNMRSYPLLDIKGTLSSSQSVTVTINDTTVTVTGPLTSSQILRLDYKSMDFGLWNTAATTKTASVVGRMSSFDRLCLTPSGNTVTVAVSGGTMTQCLLQANSRRA